MENGSKKVEEIKEIFGKAAPKMGATYLSKNLGGDKRKK
jgi:hypothetical protein